MVAQKTLTDHTEFITSKREFEEWLGRAQGTVNDCQDEEGSEAEVSRCGYLLRICIHFDNRWQLLLFRFDVM